MTDRQPFLFDPDHKIHRHSGHGPDRKTDRKTDHKQGETVANKTGGGRKHSRAYAPLTEAKLKQVAIDYLARYAASEASLRDVLERRIARQAIRDREFAADNEKQAALRAQIAVIITMHKQAGVLNDAAYAEGKIASLRRSGASKRRIEQKLAQKGVAQDTIAKTLRAHDQDFAGDRDGNRARESDGEDASAELQAALTFARKRRLGPFRGSLRIGGTPTSSRSASGASRPSGSQLSGSSAKKDAEAERKQQSRDIAALARAGFSYDVAKRALKVDSDFED